MPSSGRRKRLAAHLEAALAEVERLADDYRVGIERLEGSVRSGLSGGAVRQWFAMVLTAAFGGSFSLVPVAVLTCRLVCVSMDGCGTCVQFLRVVDLGVQIRRGEIRHRTARQFVHPCMHTTGTKGAIHSGVCDVPALVVLCLVSIQCVRLRVFVHGNQCFLRVAVWTAGLSIDDANGVYQALEHTPGVSESRLEGYFMRIDALDKDLVGVLDIRVNKCLNSLLSAKSASYHALETTGSDPHQELLLKGTLGVVGVIQRTCFRPTTCVCAEDSEPWRDFVIRPEVDPTAASLQAAVHPQTTLSVASATFLSAGSIAAAEMSALSGTDDDDVGLSELKRQFGFEPLLASDGEESGMELLKRRRLTENPSHGGGSRAFAASAIRRLTPMQIYARKVSACSAALSCKYYQMQY